MPTWSPRRSYHLARAIEVFARLPEVALVQGEVASVADGCRFHLLQAERPGQRQRLLAKSYRGLEVLLLQGKGKTYEKLGDAPAVAEPATTGFG